MGKTGLRKEDFLEEETFELALSGRREEAEMRWKNLLWEEEAQVWVGSSWEIKSRGKGEAGGSQVSRRSFWTQGETPGEAPA